MLISVSPQSRKFCFIFTITWLVILFSIFIYGTSQRHVDDVGLVITNVTEPKLQCRLQYFGSDQCGFVKDHCTRIDKLGLVPYLKWFYCVKHQAKIPLLIALSLWLTVVFAGMATAADKFLAVNLASLVHSLKISENLAGVTIFAFGNGSSDLFSTLAATNSGNGSLAIAELFGAAAFITTMVLGAIAISRPFSVDRKSFLADVACFLLAASVNLAIISDGRVALGESLVIIGLYVAFVAFVLLRDRSNGKDVGTNPVDQNDRMVGTDDAFREVNENTSLMAQPSEQISYIAKNDGLMSSAASAKTLVSETIVENGNVQEDSSSSAGSERTSISDWISDYEHMADVPPFIRLCASVRAFRADSITSFLSGFFRFPAIIVMGLTTVTQPEIEHIPPPPHEIPGNPAGTDHIIAHAPDRHRHEHRLLCAQLIFGPQFLSWLFWSHAGPLSRLTLYIICGSVFGCSLLFVLTFRKALLHPGPYLHRFLSITGFLTATAWIYLLASEAVALIETLGVISNISDALLGATIFAIGNSSDDIFANLSVAKRGHPVLASAACLGGPMLNTLLGVGFGSLIQIIKGHYRPYEFSVPASLFVSAASLLTGLSVVLVYVLFSGGKLDRILGYGLMTLWIGFTVANVYVSMKS